MPDKKTARATALDKVKAASKRPVVVPAKKAAPTKKVAAKTAAVVAKAPVVAKPPVAAGRKPALKKGAAPKAPVGLEDFLDDEVDPGEDLHAAEAVAVDDTPAKAKPLRMKVPKSKERALIREFGLDATPLSREEAEKRRGELKVLVKLGKLRGFLTQQEINDHLPEKLVDADTLEATVKMLNDKGIAV